MMMDNTVNTSNTEIKKPVPAQPQKSEREKELEEEIFEIDRLNILDCSKLEFYRDDAGFISLKYDGKEYFNVRLTRLLPFYAKTTYISVAYDDEDREFKEIGVIKDMSQMSAEQYKLVNDYLEYKYYMPEITKVHSIKDNSRGFIFVDIDTTAGRKTICIRDWYSNFRMLTDKYLYAADVDGNKYFCSDIAKLDKKSLAVLEIYI